MATIIVYAKAGLGKEKKQELIGVVKKAMSEGLKLKPEYMPVMIHEVEPEYADETAYNTLSFFIYTAPGKAVENKRLSAKLIQQEAEKAFGDQAKTLVIFKEHPHENVGVDGLLRANDETMKAYLASINNKIS